MTETNQPNKDPEHSEGYETRHAPPRAYSDASLGVFTTLSLIALVWGFCWLKSYSSFRIPQRINVQFKEVAGLSQFAGVFVDGVRVGVVEKLEWQGEHKVLTRLRINAPGVEVPEGSRFIILTNGIVGAKFVEVIFPEKFEGQEPAKPISSSKIVKGEDPIRPEIAVNNIAVGLSRIDMVKLSDNFDADRLRLVRAADQLSILAKKAMPVVDLAVPLGNELLELTKDSRRIFKRVDDFLVNPKIAPELERAARDAKATMISVESTVKELSITLKDESLRKDLVDSVHTLYRATENIQGSVEALHEITGDKELRSDFRSLLKDVSSCMSQVDNLIKSPAFKTDLANTSKDLRAAINHLDRVARQLSQMLGKRFPLVQMMIGRPGYIKEENIKEGNNINDTEATPSQSR